MSGCFASVRTRRYIEGKQRIDAKGFKACITDFGSKFTFNSDKYPSQFTISKHDDYAAIAWFESAKYPLFPVPLIWDNTRYPRLIFICPCCELKRLYLYGVPNGWACRHCIGLHYSVQSMGTEERLRKRIRKIRRKIWGDNASMDTFEMSYPFGKPKGVSFDKFCNAVQLLNSVEVRYLRLAEKRFLTLDAKISKLAVQVFGKDEYRQ